MSKVSEAVWRCFLRDPIEHDLWLSSYPGIAAWSMRPYFKPVAYSLTIASRRFSFEAMPPTRYESALKRWRAAQAVFIADTEYHSCGAISTKLVELGDGVAAEFVCGMSDQRQPVIQSAKRTLENKRVELKRILTESGLPSLLEDERYEPSKYSERLGDVPVTFKAKVQASIFAPTRMTVKVKSLYDAVEPDDGYRLLCDFFPPRIHPKRAAPYDLRIGDGLPSRRLFEWFANDPERWAEFQHYHHRQLHGDHAGMTRLLNRFHGESLTLLHLDRGELSIARSLSNYLVEHFAYSSV